MTETDVAGLVERLRADVAMFYAARENPDKAVRYALVMDTGNALRNSANRAADALQSQATEIARLRALLDLVIPDDCKPLDATPPETADERQAAIVAGFQRAKDKAWAEGLQRTAEWLLAGAKFIESGEWRR